MKIFRIYYRLIIFLLGTILHWTFILGSKVIHYEVYLIRSGRLGHLALNTEWFLRKRRIQLGKKVYAIIISPKLVKSNYVANLYLLSEYLNVLEKEKNIIVIKSTILHRILHNKKININERTNYYLPNHPWNNDWSKMPRVLNLSEENINKGREMLKKIGVKDSTKIVAIFARDTEYLSNRFPDKNWSYHDYRNADINTYIKSIEYLIKNGYTVIRVGSSVNKKVSFSHEKFIDYPFTNIRSEFLDIIIVYLSKFVIGTTSGAVDTAVVFNKPFLGVNFAPFTESPFGKYDQYIQKKLVDINSNKIIKFKDFIGRDLSNTYNSKKFRSQYDVTYLDNTEDEIFNAVIEFEDRIKDTPSDQNNECSDHLNEYHEKYWKKMPCKLINPKISCSWLKKNKDLYI